jgi:putative transposase
MRRKFNRRHRFVGHVLQGRYKAILVQRESYLLELCRYVVLNPVRAGIVAAPEDWAWSSYCATLGIVQAPEWLAIDWVLSQFGNERDGARQNYRAFVLAGVGEGSPLAETQHQVILGDPAFVERHSQQLVDVDFTAITKEQRRLAAKTFAEYQAGYADRDEAMYHAYLSTAFSMAQIAEYFGVSDKTVSRAVKKCEAKS